MEILEVLEVEVEILVDTVAEVKVKKLGNTAADVETKAVVEMQDDKLASGRRESGRHSGHFAVRGFVEQSG